jgi:hypothetical protein
MKQQKPNKKKGINTFIRYSSLGFEMMAIIGLGTFLGFKIDQWLENQFKGFTLGLMIISVILSIIFGIRNLLKNK